MQQQVFFFLKFIHYFIKYNIYVFFQLGIAAVLLQAETVHSALRLAPNEGNLLAQDALQERIQQSVGMRDLPPKR